jgi:hypothetical protein
LQGDIFEVFGEVSVVEKTCLPYDMLLRVFAIGNDSIILKTTPLVTCLSGWRLFFKLGLLDSLVKLFPLHNPVDLLEFLLGLDQELLFRGEQGKHMLFLKTFKSETRALRGTLIFLRLDKTKILSNSLM